MEAMLGTCSMHKGDAILIEWLDTAGYDDAGWVNTDVVEDMEPIAVVTVGTVVKVTSKFVTVSLSVQEDFDFVMGSVSIPFNQVKRIDRLSKSTGLAVMVSTTL